MSTKKTAKFIAPSRAVRHHQEPLSSPGRRASSSSPNGSARTAAPKSGRSGGRKVSVT